MRAPPAAAAAVEGAAAAVAAFVIKPRFYIRRYSNESRGAGQNF